MSSQRHSDDAGTRVFFHNRPRTIVFILLILIVLGGLFLAMLLTWGPSRVAIMVVDSTGKPIPDALIEPYGLRRKSDGGNTGHWLWLAERHEVPPVPVRTGADGVAEIRYPRYVSERLETGAISVQVHHPRFVSAGSWNVVVATSPASGAGWAAWSTYLLNKLRESGTAQKPFTVALESGQHLVIKPGPVEEPGYEYKAGWSLLAQTSSPGAYEPDFWNRSRPGVIATGRHAEGTHRVRLIGLQGGGKIHFSDITRIDIVSGMTNRVEVPMKPGIDVHGRLGDAVPRPVSNGRVIAEVHSPMLLREQERSIKWHSWARINADGSFTLPSMPAGKLEIIAICDGFVTGGGRWPTVLPQQFDLSGNTPDIVLEMEPTTVLELTLVDEEEHPVEGAKVSSWPNVRWGNNASTILGSDLFNTADRLLSSAGTARQSVPEIPADFTGVSDSNGVARIPSLPFLSAGISVDHPDNVLPPAVGAGAGTAPGRSILIPLSPGGVVRHTLTLEPPEKRPLRHYY